MYALLQKYFTDVLFGDFYEFIFWGEDWKAEKKWRNHHPGENREGEKDNKVICSWFWLHASSNVDNVCAFT